MTVTNIQFQQYSSERLYPVNYKFTLKRGKQPAKEFTIVNYAITHNLNGKIASFEYVVNYDFCGQTMTKNMVQTTIDIATNNGWKGLQNER